MTDQFDDFNAFDDDLDQEPTFEDALLELQDDDQTMPSPALVLGLSSLNAAQVAQISTLWHKLDPDYRSILAQMLVDAQQRSYRVDYTDLAPQLLQDEHANVRQAAIEMLGFDESIEWMDKLISIVQTDPDEDVRIEAIKSLGNFILLGDIQTIPLADAQRAQTAVLSLIKQPQQATAIRCRAIEAIANCTRDDVPDIIQQAYTSQDSDLQQSAIIAMGNSYDERWESVILDQLNNRNEDMRLAATIAAGKLSIAEAVGQLQDNFNHATEAEGIEIIGALGEIGGTEALNVLRLIEKAEQAKDDSLLLAIIEDAIATASMFGDDMMLINIDDLQMDD